MIKGLNRSCFIMFICNFISPCYYKEGLLRLLSALHTSILVALRFSPSFVFPGAAASRVPVPVADVAILLITFFALLFT